MPQTYDAGAFFLARLALEQDAVDALERSTRLGASQLRRARGSMQAAHLARRVPAGDAAFLERALAHGGFDMSRRIDIDDEKLQYIWNRFRQRAVGLARALAARADGLRVATQVVEGFRSRECRALLTRFRAQYDRRLQGCDREAARLRIAVLACLGARLRPPLPAAALQELLGS